MRRKSLISEIIHNIDKHLCFYIFLEYSWLCTLFLPLLYVGTYVPWWGNTDRRAFCLILAVKDLQLKSCLLNWSTSAEKQHRSLLLYTFLCWLWTWHKLWRSLTGSLFSFSIFRPEIQCLGLCVQFSSVAQSCPTLCNPMSCSTPGLPVHHQLPDFTQTHVHWVHDAI